MPKKSEETKKAKAIIKEKEKEVKKIEKTEEKTVEEKKEVKETEEKKTEEKKIEKPKKKEKTEEKIMTFSLKDAWKSPRTRRTRTAVKVLRDQIKRHVKKQEVKIDKTLNEVLWSRGIQKPPRKIKVKLVISETKVTAYPVK